MPGNTLKFEDGSTIRWASRESVHYTEAGYEVEVWVDMAEGFFSRKKIIRTQSLSHWTNMPPDSSSREIPESKVTEIIEKIRRFYPGRPIEVE